MKHMMFIGLMGMFVVIAANPVWACHIYFEPEALETVSVGDVVTIEVVIEKEHRRCVLDDDDVNVTLSENAEIVSQQEWEAQGRSDIVNTFDIKILEAGTIRLHIFRECSKKGISENILEFEAT